MSRVDGLPMMMNVNMKGKPGSNNIVIVSDWDETITEKDTIGIIGQLPYRIKKEYRPDFDYFTQTYLQAYNNYKQQFGDVYTLEEEIQFQRGMGPVEMQSINEIERLKLFSGITKDQFRKCSQEIKLRQGFVEFARKCNMTNIPLYIVSINWTHLIIEKVLAKYDISATVVTNELEFVDEVATGKWDKSTNIRTAPDKQNEINRIRNQHPHHCVVYVGDSTMDLLALLGADVGIIVDQGSIIAKLDKLHIEYGQELPKIACFDHACGDTTRQKPTLYKANWLQITESIFS
jgi:HAD superfamily phosphoserine phosphatase-like hydrolase